jgi:tetratricopeptide (TPR) repeat protein
MITRQTLLTAIACTVLWASYTSSSACQQSRQSTDPEYNFEVLWQTFDRNYALFGPKRIDWAALYRVYRPMVNAETSDEELFEVMSNLLEHLNDNHVGLAGDGRQYRSGILNELDGTGFRDEEMADFSIGLVRSNYLVSEIEARGRLRFAWLPDSIGYLRIRGFGQLAETTEAIDAVMNEFEDAKAVVIDLRATPGGDDQVGKAIASRFADRKRLYMKTYERNGPEHDDFAPPRYFYVEPQGPVQFTRTLVVLTNRWGISAAENFALAMRVLPHATLIGDFTSGVFADVYGDVLPNGWRFGVSYKLFVDATGFCWEGIGVPMDLRITNAPEDVAAGRDRVLEFALEFIERGEPSPRNVPSSVEDIRDSWAELLTREMESDDPGDAIAEARALRDANPMAFYVDEDELLALTDRLAAEGHAVAAALALEAAAEVLKESYRPWQALGEAYLRSGDTVEARKAFSKSLERNRRSYPWEKQAAEVADAVVAGQKVLVPELEAAASDDAFTTVLRDFERDPDAYFFTATAVNALGYQLLGSGLTARAIEVFLINTRQYPRSANVWDSLGDGYRANGEIDQAIASYRRALEIDPNFDASRRNIAELQQERQRDAER